MPGSDNSLTWNCHLLMERWPFDLYFIMEGLWHVSILIIIYSYCLSPIYVQIVWKIQQFYGFFSIVWLTIFMSYYTRVKYSIDIYIFFFEDQSCQIWEMFENLNLKTCIYTILWSKFKKNLKWSLAKRHPGYESNKGV